MRLKNGFIINAPEHLRPMIRISPFNSVAMYENKEFENVADLSIKDYFLAKFPNSDMVLTDGGRGALGAALSMLELKKEDIVTIVTTTNSFYISSCVTDEINKYCQWSRDIETNTKVILVNHEFGFYCQDIMKYAALGYPIIEDFAHSFISEPIIQNADHHSDFLIFSFPKYFPVQVGGALIYNKNYHAKYKMESNLNSYITNVTSNYVEQIDNIKLKRLANYQYYIEKFANEGLEPFFNLQKNDCPGVYCFRTPSEVNLQEMKKFMNSNGIESSVFYGENAYFLPCHQNIEKHDIDYIYTVLKFFIEATI